MKLYPFDVPAGFHPNIWWLMGFGLTVEQANALARHLCDDLGVRFGEDSGEVTISWAVGLVGVWEDRIIANVGDSVDIVVSDSSAVRITGGSLPPGVSVEKHSGKLVGTLTHSGLYSVTVTIGSAVKYDPLGTPGGPGDPGIWIPINQPRQQVATALSGFPATADDLSDREKDYLLAELLAWRDGEVVKEADRGD